MMLTQAKLQQTTVIVWRMNEGVFVVISYH